jgi:hypothetical protein
MTPEVMTADLIARLTDQQSPFLNPVWLFAIFLGALGIYVAIVVSDDYGATAFFLGALLTGAAFFIGVFAFPILTLVHP